MPIFHSLQLYRVFGAFLIFLVTSSIADNVARPECASEAEKTLAAWIGKNLTFTTAETGNYSEAEKRQIRNICLEKCFTPYTDDFAASSVQLTSNPLDKQLFQHVFLDAEKLTEVCVKFNESNLAVPFCPFADITTRTELTWMKLFKHLCLLSNYMEHIQCYKAVYSQTDESCDSAGKCKETLDILVAEFHRPVTLNQVGLAPFPVKYVQAGCNYIKCRRDCRAPKILEQCGRQAVDELEKMYDVLVQLADHIAKTSTDYSDKARLPRNCNALSLTGIL